MLFGTTQAQPSENDPPNRNSKAQCWTARDVYFGCLAQNHQQKREGNSSLSSSPDSSNSGTSYVIRARYREFDAWRHVLDTLANIGAPVPGLRMATPQQTARPTAHFPLNLARGTPSAVLCEAYQEGSPSHEYYCSSFLSLCLKA
ncbi:hypothetical protein KEM48_011975 [Puccinia striiformis f. sp. tritici PST-130]|uniref:Uncharacterized protein n=1 Tax=Puccinia striiformis f. sp. tritici PST-78 TaxID=1165861 RepID=A0A0L0VTR4_9BASI|nr:hypothetical protein KEM48_011975 [Puccinia striiformis f. sp. tritici PST-130]KNF02674.1 hypothetical protein PSTG_03960 [Puccinia striiformis f. sp. tritici PST-78]